MPPLAIQPGEIVAGRFQIQALIGQGGMAVVYCALHLNTRATVALKLVHPHLVTHPSLLQRFVQESQINAKIGRSPHIVDVIDAGVDEARRVPYLAMELLEGETLQEHLEREGALPWPMVRAIMAQLGEALDQAHRAGVVHRDLKPSNLFLSKDRSGRPVVKVLDFGIAKVLEGEGGHTATEIGTPAYAAPEQLGAAWRDVAARQGVTISRDITPATDVWSLGLVAYVLLTGLPASQYWDTQTPAELPLKVGLGAASPASVRAGDRAKALPPGFDAWLARCLEKDARSRWPSAEAAVAALAPLLDGVAPAIALPYAQPTQAPRLTQPTPLVDDGGSPGKPGSAPKPPGYAAAMTVPGAPPLYTPHGAPPAAPMPWVAIPTPTPAGARRGKPQWPLLLGAVLAIGMVVGFGVVLPRLVAKPSGDPAKDDEPRVHQPAPQPPPFVAPTSNEPKGPTPLTDESAEAAAKLFYETKGEFHGQYEMARFEAIRLVRVADDRYEAHLRYRFQCLRRVCCCGSAGFDQRIFYLQWRDGRWEGTRMSGNMTAKMR